ncbi:hypothetical protein NHF40_00530 [Maricaulaceae bacterium EIL42A08]|nr:hypothetical protein [Maricaulaceae bacterium EIL42A08]
MTGTRKLEISLAALIACGAMFGALVPGAISNDRGVYEPPLMDAPTAQISASEFEGLAVSSASRAVAAEVMSGDAQPSRFAPATLNRDQLTPPPGVQVSPRASAASGPAWSGEAVGLEVTYALMDAEERRWWLVGGAGRESYAVAPAGLREFTVAPVSAETTIGDAHLGVAFALNDNAYASLGYVRENRKFTLGTEDWEEDEHYLGVGVQARW